MAKGHAKDLEKLIAQVAATPGWRVERAANGYYRIFAPDGVTLIQTGATPQDWRANRNLLAQLRRAGYDPKGG